MVECERIVDYVWKEYDEYGNLIYYKDSKGSERLWEYDEHDNCVHWKNNKGYEQVCKYECGKVVYRYRKEPGGFEIHCKFDKHGYVTYHKIIKNEKELEEYWKYD